MTWANDLKTDYIHELELDWEVGVVEVDLPNGARFMSVFDRVIPLKQVMERDLKISIFFHVIPTQWIDNEPVKEKRTFFIVDINEGSSFSFGTDRMGRSVLLFLGTLQSPNSTDAYHIFEVVGR